MQRHQGAVGINNDRRKVRKHTDTGVAFTQESTGNVCALVKNQGRSWTREDIIIVGEVERVLKDSKY
jgi:hypothetical protein